MRTEEKQENGGEGIQEDTQEGTHKREHTRKKIEGSKHRPVTNMG